MATIEISRTHALGKDEAKNRTNTVLEKMKSSQGIQGTWSGDTFNITKPATGTFMVTDTLVQIAIDLPFMLRPLKGTIEQRINQELDKALA